MKLNEAIKNKDNFLITKDGQILGIKNENCELEFGDNVPENILESEIKKIEVIKGMIADITCFRL